MDLIIKPRQITITWGDDDRYWEWIDGETPRLLSVYWFKIRGRFAMSRLTHGAKYQLTFEVELESWAKGWESPVTLKMVFPDGRSTTRVETLDHHPREQLLMLCVGEFEASGNGEIKFEMTETLKLNEKKGMVIRRVVIQHSQDLNMEQRQLSTTGGDYLNSNDIMKKGLVVKQVMFKSSQLVEPQCIAPSPPNYYGSRDVGGGGRRFCYYCGETGHTSDECPMKGLSKIEVVPDDSGDEN